MRNVQSLARTDFFLQLGKLSWPLLRLALIGRTNDGSGTTPPFFHFDLGKDGEKALCPGGRIQPFTRGGLWYGAVSVYLKRKPLNQAVPRAFAGTRRRCSSIRPTARPPHQFTTTDSFDGLATRHRLKWCGG